MQMDELTLMILKVIVSICAALITALFCRILKRLRMIRGMLCFLIWLRWQ